MPKSKKAVLEAEEFVKEEVKDEKKESKPLTTMEEVCGHYRLEYRPGATRLVDIAKQMEVYYTDGMTLEELVKQYEAKK